ncbi:MAG: NADH-ubiquinone oxidoreductase-F iron-sulfur binding region domain-containing protein [Gaiellaceae bacterium]
MSSAAVARPSVVRPHLAGPNGLPRLLAGVREDGRAESLRSHLDRYGATRESTRGDELISAVEASGLTGRGGASFPAGVKLRTVADRRRRPIVLINGAEGEPASSKDRALLHAVPHLVLDGAVLAAEAVDAREVVVAVGSQAAPEQAALAAAVAERERNRIDKAVSIRVVPVPAGFVAGEETALIRFLNGGPPKPTLTPPRPFECGIGGAPTLVLNVETFAQVALIARFGSDWFRELGTTREPGSTLLTITGAVGRPGVHEIGLGTSFADLVEEAGGLIAPVSAFLVGGYFGTWLRAETALELRLLDAELTPHGAELGARAIVALPAHACAVHEIARVARYLSNESAGQCGPCVHGLAAIASGLERVAAGKGDDRAQLARWVDVVRGRGACKHPDGATRFVASALDVFDDEVQMHLRRGRCRTRAAALLPLPNPGRRR